MADGVGEQVVRRPGDRLVRHDLPRAACGDDVVLVNILPFGTLRQDWRATVVGDGWVMVRHHEVHSR